MAMNLISRSLVMNRGFSPMNVQLNRTIGFNNTISSRNFSDVYNDREKAMENASVRQHEQDLLKKIKREKKT